MVSALVKIRLIVFVYGSLLGIGFSAISRMTLAFMQNLAMTIALEFGTSAPNLVSISAAGV
ncbi:MAG: hypothetical protein ACJAYC_001430 [Halieaceae bacterium]|jgi:hypothetical protein